MTFKEVFPYISFIIVVLIIPIVGYFIKKYDDHIKECSKIPNSLLLEKMEGLCEKQDIYQTANDEKFKALTNSTEQLHSKTNRLAVSVATLTAVAEEKKKRA